MLTQKPRCGEILRYELPDIFKHKELNDGSRLLKVKRFEDTIMYFEWLDTKESSLIIWGFKDGLNKYLHHLDKAEQQSALGGNNGK